MQRAEPAAAGDRLVEHRAARHFGHVLPEVADGQLPRDRHVALVRLFLADDHAEERRLAGAVGADQSDFFAWIELKGRVDEQHLAAVLFADAGERNHSGSLTFNSAPKSIVRSLSCAAHLASVATLVATRPSNTVLPSATTVIGFEKSNAVRRQQQRELGYAPRGRGHRVAVLPEIDAAGRLRVPEDRHRPHHRRRIVGALQLDLISAAGHDNGHRLAFVVNRQQVENRNARRDCLRVDPGNDVVRQHAEARGIAAGDDRRDARAGGADPEIQLRRGSEVVEIVERLALDLRRGQPVDDQPVARLAVAVPSLSHVSVSGSGFRGCAVTNAS